MVTLGTFRVLEIIDDGKIIYGESRKTSFATIPFCMEDFFSFFFIELVESSVKEDEKG